MRVLHPKANDLSLVAACHRKAFPSALSTAMGQSYVEKMLEWYLVDDRAFIFYVEEEGECVGYCGGLKADGIYRVGSASSMIQHSFFQAVQALLLRPWLLLHRELRNKYGLAFRNVLKRIKRMIGVPERPSVPPVGVRPHTGLVVIGVNPAHQGKGYGRILLQEFERQSAGFGFDLMTLTVRTSNTQAIKAYRAAGWSLTDQNAASTAMHKKIET